MPRKYTPEERIAAYWSKVQKSSDPDGCWLWTGGIVGGYGQTWWHGKHCYAHRVSYELAYGPFADDLDVLHSCDNPRCVNPVHLFVGTHQDNMHDMIQKNRHRRASGENHPMHKLTWDDIAEIRQKRAAGALLRELAVEFHVHEAHISRIALCKTWRIS